MKTLYFQSICLGLVALFLLSCEQEGTTEPALLTEEVLYLSGEQVRLLGRVITNQEINASDHGFYIGDNENFSNPIIVSLGQKARPGRFIGEYIGLETERTYYAKSFATINGKQIYSNTINFTTLSTDLISVSPNNGRPGDIVEISGKNFTADTKVLFGQTPAEIIDISFESKIRVRVPSSGNRRIETVQIISQGTEVENTLLFEYTSGLYRKLESDFPLPKLYSNIHFQYDGEFFIGLGRMANVFQLNSKIWKYNTLTNRWVETSYGGGPQDNAFSAGNYFGGGAGTAAFSTDFWKFEQGSFVKLSDLPFHMANSIAFTLNQTLYVVGGGILEGRQIFRYDPGSGIWELKGVLPFPVSKSFSIHFGDGKKHFFINTESKEIFSFNGNNEDITKEGTFPGPMNPDIGFGVVLNDKAYIGLSARSNRIYEWDLTSFTWKLKNDFPGTTIGETIGIFTKNDLIYLLRSPIRSSPLTIEFWEFDPMGF